MREETSLRPAGSGATEAQLADGRSHGTGYCRTCPMCSSRNQIGCSILPKPFWLQLAPWQPPGKFTYAFEIPSKTRDYGKLAWRIAYSASCFYLWICSGIHSAALHGRNRSRCFWLQVTESSPMTAGDSENLASPPRVTTTTLSPKTCTKW